MVNGRSNDRPRERKRKPRKKEENNQTTPPTPTPNTLIQHPQPRQGKARQGSKARQGQVREGKGKQDEVKQGKGKQLETSNAPTHLPRTRASFSDVPPGEVQRGHGGGFVLAWLNQQRRGRRQEGAAGQVPLQEQRRAVREPARHLKRVNYSKASVTIITGGRASGSNEHYVKKAKLTVSRRVRVV